jgi:hypothetical protein
MKMYHSLLEQGMIKHILAWVLFFYLVVANLTTH